MRDIVRNYDEFMDFLGESFGAIISIAADPEIAKAMRGGVSLLVLVPHICKNHSESVAQVVASYQGVPLEEFKKDFSVINLMKAVTSILNNETIMGLFRSAEQKTDATSSGSASENALIED